MSEFEELTDEERQAELARIHAIAGAPLTEEQMAPRPPMQIPGPPTAEAAARGKQIRVDVARDLLQNLQGDESPEFLAKLNKEAGFTAENASAPANGAAGFTPPVAVSAEQPEIDLVTLPDGSFGPRPGPRELIEAELNPEPEFLDIPADLDGPPQLAAVPGSELPISGGGPMEFLRDYGRNAGEQISQFGADIYGGMTSLLPNLADESNVFGPAVAAELEGFGDADAGERGAMIGNTVMEATGGTGRLITELARDTIGKIGTDPLSRGVGGFIEGIGEGLGIGGGNEVQASELDKNPPPVEVVEEDPPGTEEVETHGDTSRGDAAQKAAEDAVGVGGGRGEPAVSTSFISDEAGQESGPTTFEDTPTGIHINNPEIDGPPLEGMEIIRGLNRSFQPFDETGRIPQGSGEIPFGDDRQEQLANLGFTRDQQPGMIAAEAQNTLARNNALTRTQVQNDQGQMVEAFMFMDDNNQIQTIESDNLVDVGSNLLATMMDVPFTDALGNTTSMSVPVYFEPFTDENGQTAIRRVREDVSHGVALARAKFPIEWAAAVDSVSEQGLTGAARLQAAQEIFEANLPAQ